VHGQAGLACDAADLGGFLIAVHPAQGDTRKAMHAFLGETHLREDEINELVKLGGDVGVGDCAFEVRHDVVVAVLRGHRKIDREARRFMPGNNPTPWPVAFLFCRRRGASS